MRRHLRRRQQSYPFESLIPVMKSVAGERSLWQELLAIGEIASVYVAIAVSSRMGRMRNVNLN